MRSTSTLIPLACVIELRLRFLAQVGLRGAVDEQANFQTFWGSMVLLLRFSTGENWNGFMYDMVADREDCEPNPVYDPDMCGFTNRANCTPLNGCGSYSIFPYMIRYVCRICMLKFTPG